MVHNPNAKKRGIRHAIREQWQHVFGRANWDSYVEEKEDYFLHYNPKPAIDMDIHLPKLKMF